MNEIVIPQEVFNFLTLCYATSATNQRAGGVRFNLTFDDYLEVVRRHPGALQSIIKRYMERKAKNNTMRSFKTCYVLSWVSREAKAAGIMDKDTAKYMSDRASLEMFKLKKGDNHTPASCELIRQARLGKKAKDSTRSKMSDSHTGVRKSEESKQRARQSALRNAAAKRIALEIGLAQ